MQKQLHTHKYNVRAFLHHLLHVTDNVCIHIDCGIFSPNEVQVRILRKVLVLESDILYKWHKFCNVLWIS